jgi:hypothetical protein
MDQVVELLSSKYKALSLSPSITLTPKKGIIFNDVGTLRIKP